MASPGNNSDNDTTAPNMKDASAAASRTPYYEVLGLTSVADEEEIKAAYRRLAMKWHPDKNPSPDATSKFQEISYAYRKLTTDESDSDDDVEFSAEDIFLSVFGPLFRFGRNKNSKVVFNMSDFVCPHHREFASRFFDSSSDSEWDSEDSYYDYEYDTDEDEDSDSDFFYSFHTHPPQKQPKPKEPGVPDRPAPPRLLESTDVSLKVGWDAPSNNGAPILFYSLEMDTGVVAGANFNEIYKGKKRSYEVKRLIPGTTYHFLVKAANKYGAGGFSRVASFMTQGSTPRKKGGNKGPAENGGTGKNKKKKKRRAKKKQAQENGTSPEEQATQETHEETDNHKPKQAAAQKKGPENAGGEEKQAKQHGTSKTAEAAPKGAKKEAGGGGGGEKTNDTPKANQQTPSQKGKQQHETAKPKPVQNQKQNASQNQPGQQQQKQQKQPSSTPNTKPDDKDKVASAGKKAPIPDTKPTTAPKQAQKPAQQNGTPAKAKAKANVESERVDEAKSETNSKRVKKQEGGQASNIQQKEIQQKEKEQQRDKEKEQEEKAKEKEKPKGGDSKQPNQKRKGNSDNRDDTEVGDARAPEVAKRNDGGPSDDKDDGSVVRLRGLPWEVTREDIAKFFAGLTIARDGVCIALNFDARPTGDGFVRFINAEQAKEALSRHMNYMGRRYICVERSTVLGFNSCSLFAKTILDRKRQQALAFKAKPGPDALAVNTKRISATDNGSNEERIRDRKSANGESEEYFSAPRERVTRSRGRGRGKGAKNPDGLSGNDPAVSRTVELQGLKEMGFEEEEAIEALRKGLNLELTIEWLLEQRGEKERKTSEGSSEDTALSDRSPRHRVPEPNRGWETVRASAEDTNEEMHEPEEGETEENEEEEEEEEEPDEYVNSEDENRGEDNGGIGSAPPLRDLNRAGRERDASIEPEHREWYGPSQDRLGYRPQPDRSRAMPMPPVLAGRVMPLPMRPARIVGPIPGAGMPAGMPTGLPVGMPPMPGGIPAGLPGMPMGGLPSGLIPLSSDGLAREKQLSSSLWIGNVSQKVREEELRALFVPFGEIVSLKILRRSQCAFVNYSSPSAATAAKRHIQGKILRDMRLEINFSKPPKAQRREERLPIPLMMQRPRPTFPVLRREDDGLEGQDRAEGGLLPRLAGLGGLKIVPPEKPEAKVEPASPDGLQGDKIELPEGKSTAPVRPIERPGSGSSLPSVSPRRSAPASATAPGYSHFPVPHAQPEVMDALSLPSLHSGGGAADEFDDDTPEGPSDLEESEIPVPDAVLEMEKTSSPLDREQEYDEYEGDLSFEDRRGVQNYPWMDGEGYGNIPGLGELGDLGELGPLDSLSSESFGNDEGEVFDTYPPSLQNGFAGNTPEDRGSYGGYGGRHMYSHYDSGFGQEAEPVQEQTAVPSSYGLFGWQPKPYGGTVGGHLSMNIWGYSGGGVQPQVPAPGSFHPFQPIPGSFTMPTPQPPPYYEP